MELTKYLCARSITRKLLTIVPTFTLIFLMCSPLFCQTHSVTLSCTPSGTSGVSVYEVLRSLVTGGPYGAVSTSAPCNSYTDGTVANGTTYYYVMRALLNGVESINSNEVKAIIPGVVPPPPPPPPATTATVSTQSFSIAWTVGTGSPASQVLRIVASDGNQYPFTATVNQGGAGTAWLSVTPTGQSTPSNQTLAFKPTGLPAGVYPGSITFSSSSFASVVVPVTLTVSGVTPPPPPPPTQSVTCAAPVVAISTVTNGVFTRSEISNCTITPH